MCLNKKRKEIKFIVIDDFQYLMANEFMNRAYEKGYDKWTEIGKHAFDLLFKTKTLGNNRVVFVLAHSDTNDLGDTDVKTLGKMLSEKIVVAGMTADDTMAAADQFIAGIKRQ